MGRIIDRRRVMGGESLPYDAEIEYLESDGNAYIDTGIIPSSDIKLTIDGSFLQTNPSTQFGVIDMHNNIYRRFHLGVSHGFWQAGIGNTYDTKDSADTNRHLFQINGFSGEAYIDNLRIVGNNNAFPTLPIYLFARNFDGTPTPSLNRIISANIYTYSQDKFLMDYIPVRVGTTGYMYDKVSGTLFGNSGTGSFILGLDKGIKNVSINVKTHSTGGSDASLDVITENREPVNILFRDAQYPKYWTNEYIKVVYISVNIGWQLFAVTPCLYDGQIYKKGDLITNWVYTEIKDITIIVNYEEIL